jgi:hypothetical protein
MLTLIFNTTEKTARVYSDYPTSFSEDDAIEFWREVPTVKVREDGIYEIYQTGSDGRVYPVARFPVNQTVMLIRK